MKSPPLGSTCRLLLTCTVVAASAAFNTPALAADPGRILVQTDKPGAKISPLLFGLMTEEINYSYEGGLYAELIQNRSFRNPVPPPPKTAPGTQPAPTPAPPDAINGVPHWFLVGSPTNKATASLDTADPLSSALPTSLKLTIPDLPANTRAGIANDGFWGIPAKPNTPYQCSFYAKASDGFQGPLAVSIESADGKTTHATATVPALTNQWQRYTLTLKTADLTPSATNRLVLSAASKGTVHFNLVSLFPPVYKERTGTALGSRPATGFRTDIMQLLADLNPAFLRFPGGNYIEGDDFANRFDFKKTIGPWEQRPGHMSPWKYWSTDGMGLLEFLEWCEDLNMEPVLGVYAGLNLDNAKDLKTGDALKPLIQDALDEIEYVSGPATSTWGAKRAADGHPAPFKLTYVEIGNEDFLNNGSKSYVGPEGRFALFYNAIKAKYPAIQVVATMDPKVPCDVIDNHHYMAPTEAIRQAHAYDKTDRKGPKIFEGEWASQEYAPPGAPRRPLTPTFQCAIGDAVFMTGLQRNADIVIMSCYAPLLTRVDDGGNQWRTNLIGYDSLTAYGSPAYYTQKMFFNARGDVVLPIEITPQPVSAAATQAAAARNWSRRDPKEPLYACASTEAATGDIILKVVNIFDSDQTVIVDLASAKILKNATAQILAGQPDDTNTITDPLRVIPKDLIINDASSTWTHTFPGSSITVIRFKTR